MGPHGLVVGATGSGKSELLRTIVLSLAATHSPELLNVVLVDFRGGATFAPLAGLPHVAAVITDRDGEPALVDRLADAISGELTRRQEVLRRAGNLASLRDYEEAPRHGAPLPTLLIVCDEFSDLLTARPDFIDVFVQIGRVGRSLGVHLLLASQRLEEGRLRGLDTHLSYRIGLRTFTTHESRMVLGVPDAYELARPGDGYLRVGTDPMVRFKAAYVSGPFRDPAPTSWEEVLSESRRPGRLPSVVDVLAGALAGQGPAARQVWLPPLASSPAIDELAGPLTAMPARGLTLRDLSVRGTLQVPVGLVDRPYERRQDVLWLNLFGVDGHVAVVGGPQSGKSTTLRTLVTGLALTHTPAEVQVYCLDLGGGQLAALRGLPHVGGVASLTDRAAVRRTVGEVANLLDNRRRSFPADGTDMATYRKRRAAGGVDDPFGDVFLVVDGWDRLRAEYEDLENALTFIAIDGLPCGIHLAAASSRWMDFPPTIRESFGSRLELRLRDPVESSVSRRAAANVPAGMPGRGITTDQLHFLIARPTLSGGEPADLANLIATSWPGPPAPRVRMLPAVVPFSTIEDVRDENRPWALPIGVAEDDLQPVLADFEADPHFLVFGDAESGKSTFLRLVATTITTRFTPEQARIVIVDYRRSLRDAVQTEHQVGYGGSSAQAAELLSAVGRAMRERLPAPDVTTKQLRDRSWWAGPEFFVLVDDYELVAVGSASPLLPLVDLLPQAPDIGLHLILARRGGGAARAMYEPVIQRLREASTPGLILSVNHDEGPLLGTVRPSIQPPGRGWLVPRRDAARLVQVATPPDAP